MKSFLFVLLFFQNFCCFAQTKDLDYFIGRARQNSPLIREYQSQIQSLGIDSQLLKSALGPQVNFLSSNSYAPVIAGWGYDEAITNIANISALVQANRNFLTKANIAGRYRAIALQKQALIDTILLSAQDLVRLVTDQYITTYGDLLTRDFIKEVYDLMVREEIVIKKLTEASVYKQTDYLAFFVTMQQQELGFLQADIQYQTDYLTLNYLSGLMDTTIERVDKPVLSDTVTTDFFNSVFYKRFDTDSLRLANEKEMIKYDYKPRIGAYTDAGYNSSMQTTPYRNFGFSLGLSLTIPIYDGHQRQLKESALDIRERTRVMNRDYYVSQYQIQVQQLRIQLRSIDQLVSKINKQIEYARTLMIANGKLLETGDITMKDYVTAVNSYLGAKNFLVQNNISRLKILNQIAYWNFKP